MAIEISSPIVRDEAFEVPGWAHRFGGFIANHPNLWIRLGNLESNYLKDRLAPIRIDRPIYVTGLARAGTTILLDILASCDGIATHQYRDFPPIFTPFAWNWWLQHIPLKESQPVERAHADGIFVTPESPEAMEEMLWMAFFPHLHDPQQDNVLDATVTNARFETFYRDHIQKLLLTRGGQRYASKNNYHISRLEYLHKLFANARFVIPIRHPVTHIASLIKEHRLFTEAHQRHPRSLAHFQRVGHFEFGADLRPINVGETTMVREIQVLWNGAGNIPGWARYWAMIYGFVADLLDSDSSLRAASLVVRFEDLCANPQSALAALCEHCGIDPSPVISLHADRLHAPTNYRAKFTETDGFFCLLIGFFTTTAHLFPYSFLRSALIELGGPGSASPYQIDVYVRAGSSPPGVTHYDPERAYTLFTSAHAEATFLIDMKGRVVHKWALPYSHVWNKHGAVPYPSTRHLFWDKAYLYPNGDLLAIYARWDEPIWDCGLLKMDENSHPEWAYLQPVHHDVTVGSNGRIYTPTMRFRRHRIPRAPELTTPIIDNYVVVLSPRGRVLTKVSVLNALARSKYRGILTLQRYISLEDRGRDPIHINSVNPMPSTFRKIFPAAAPDTVLISSRNLDSIALLDLDSRKILWLQHGPFARQHDAEFLSNGDMLLFDDVGDAVNGRNSRLLEFQPKPFKIVWQFPGDTGFKLNSEILGSVQKPPNGNVLITSGDQGRIIEVTPDKKVVWEYNNAFRQGPHKQYVPIIRWAHRFAHDQLHFKLNDQGKARAAN